MQRILITHLILFISVILHAQKELAVLTNERPGGKNFITGADIMVKERIFPISIYAFHIDSTRNRAVIQLRKTNGKWMKSSGNVVYYDLESNKQLWSRKINYLQNVMLHDNEILIQSSPVNSVRINLETGKDQWRIPKQILYINAMSDIALGYPVNHPDNIKRLEGLSLSDGRQIWFHGVNREYGWNEYFPLNDSMMMLSASGLHALNLKTGYGWDFNAITGSKDYTSAIIANSAGILLGALTGTFMTYTGYDVVTDITSDVWTDSTGIYHASRDKIVRLDPRLEKIWETELPKKKTSKSSVFRQDTVIYLVNYGVASMGLRQVDVGDPFIAAFGINSGKQLFMNMNDDYQQQIKDYVIGNGEIIALLTNRIVSYSMTDGTPIRQRKIPAEITGNGKNFSTGQYFTESDSLFLPIETLNPDKIFMVTDSMNLLTMNSEFEILEKASLKKYYTKVMSDDNFSFLCKTDQLIVINAENRKVAELNATMNSFTCGSKLYDISDKNLIEFDLSGLYSDN